MAMTVIEVMKWLSNWADDAEVGVEDGILALIGQEDAAYLAIGGFSDVCQSPQQYIDAPEQASLKLVTDRAIASESTMSGQLSDVGRFKEFLLTVEVKFSELTGFLETWIVASRNDRNVAHAIFCDQNDSLYPLSIMLEEDVRRQGLGTAMYVWAERIRKLTIVPSDDQNEPGRKFWEQHHRPFGSSTS